MSSERLIRTAANALIAAAHNYNGYNKQPADLYTHLAKALYDRQLLQSPEIAAMSELLRFEHATTKAALSRAVEDCARLAKRVAELEADE